MDSTDVRAQRILSVVDSIPKGRVATYGQIAAEAGLPGRARMVGRLLAELDPHSPLAWHRVLGASGRISPRPGPGPLVQARRLRKEGVSVAEGRLRLAEYRWDPDQD
ncbi:MAG: MGMT family protein [Planctomycetota bacterium]|nr:MGMT family protein [Planctomycetota bacterium]